MPGTFFSGAEGPFIPDDTVKERYIDFLSRLVAADSSNPPGREWPVLRRAAEFMGYRLVLDERSGYLLERTKQAVSCVEAGFLPLSPMRGCLWFRLRGNSFGSALAFTGHTDVVPVGEEELTRWDSDPFKPYVKDHRLYGRGSTDMKSGLAAALMAFRNKAERVSACGGAPDHDIYVLVTCDEEADMRGSELFLTEPWAEEIGRLIVCEPTGLELCTEGRGRTYGKLFLSGGTGHGSRRGGKNVIHKAAEIIRHMEEEDFSDQGSDRCGQSFWQILAISAQKEPCVIPDQLEMTLDARLAQGHPCEDIWKRVDRLAEVCCPEGSGYRLSYEVIDQRETWKSPEESEFVQDVKDVLTSMGIEPVETIFSGTTDASKLRRAGMEPLIIGPGDLDLAHRENESVDLRDCMAAYTLYRTLMERA